MKKKFTCLLFTVIILQTLPVLANPALRDTVVVASRKYDRGFLHRLFWGKHYREVWKEPVRVPFLDLKTEAGGLKPLEKGGSYQTKNLRMVNPQGKEYVLRSVDKDPSQSLSPGMQKSFIGRLIRDQTSVVHPYGSLIIPPMAEAAGILHANPKLVIVPNDPALGAYREEFGNMLATLEERPDGNQETTADFGYSKDVESSRKMFRKLVESSRNRVDARAFLRARLFDIWLGDWSRREDQWRWASYKTSGKSTRYRPIPRDRDHAFFKFDDGFFTWLISRYATNLQTFGPRIKHLEGLNATAAPLDRSLLVYLTRDDFKQIADSLKMQLTDAVIENAVRSWPENIYQLSGKQMEYNLKKRRDQLPKAARTYYQLLAKNVTLPGSDKSELFRLTGQDNGLLVELFKPGKKNEPDSLLASRLFKPSETKTLQLFGLGEDDVFEIKGAGNPIKKVVIYDGAGEDKVTFDAKKKKLVKVMDSGDGNELPKTRKLKVVKYEPKAEEFDGEGWLLRHRLH